MKTIRLLYPDYVSGGLDTYYFGANLLSYLLPQNDQQPLVKVDIAPPDGTEKPVTDGIYGKTEVLDGIRDAKRKIEAEAPDRIITIGGNCMVSQAPFDYLHGKYGKTGILWIDAHPDVSTVQDGYPNAHAMVLGSLLGYGDAALSDLMESPKFQPEEVLYIGLQGLHDYQQQFLEKIGISYRVQTDDFLTTDEIRAFCSRFDHVLVHLDVDVLDERFFHDTYFANPALVGDGSGGGRMTIQQLTEVLHAIEAQSDIVGLTIAEYLPFEAQRLHRMFAGLKLFQND